MTKKLILALCLLLAAPSLQAVQIVRYVDPDSPGPTHDGTSWNNAYLSLSAWNTAEATNLVTAGNYHTVYLRSSAGTADTTSLTITAASWTTGPVNYIEVIQEDFPADGIWSDTAYRLYNNNAVTMMLTLTGDLYIRFHHVCFLVNTPAPYVNRSLILTQGQSIGRTNYFLFDSCMMRRIGNNGSGSVAYQSSSNYSNTDLCNCIISGFLFGNDLDFAAILSSQASTIINVYNTTIWACYYGIRTSNAGSAKNCVIAGCTDDFSGGIKTNISNCCSEDGDGANPQGPLDGDWANEFVNAAAGNFALKLGGNCIGKGTDNPGAGLYLDDIIGTARTTVWDIGAFEYAAAPPSAFPQVIFIMEDE